MHRCFSKNTISLQDDNKNMNTLEEIKQVIREELKQFDKEFTHSMKSNIPLLNIVTNYLLRRKGKQIRPILVFLSAKLISDVTPSTYAAAKLIELLHTATLVHDDVVDDSHERRGFLSINALWRSKLAVLLGDYLLSRGLLTALETNDFDLLRITSEAVQEMSEGEFLQIQKTRKLNITEEEYFTIIRKKTATLLASCTASGARSVTDDIKIVAKMKEFGINLGIAFQIKDDLFDYEKTSLTGKPKGNDIQEKKLTLPLIAALAKCDIKKRKEIIKLINKKSSKRDTYNTVFEFVHEYNGMEYAIQKMNEYRDNSLNILRDFPQSEVRDSMEKLINYVVERKK
jgi:octaprenyl-diphosphate synthase